MTRDPFTLARRMTPAIAMLSLTGLTGLAAGATAAVATEPASTLDPWPMVLGLLGGLALFLFGMDLMTDGLKAAAGSRMKQFLARFTSNRVKAAATGAAVTALIQSSSITTVLLVGFVSAGLMSLTQSIGVIMGSNVGTTLTAQLVAFQVDKLALLLLAAGFATMSFARRGRGKQIGSIVLGLGLVFFGMGMMSEAMNPLRGYQPFIDWMGRMDKPMLGILAGLLFTALVQSSSATTGVVIALASQGLISLPAGIALIFGSNVGTCVTALLASLGKSREARRVALAHVLFNVLGVALWLAFIPQLAELVTSISPQVPELSGRARLAAELPRQVANAHTIFNVANTLLLLPFAGLLAALIMRLVPNQPDRSEPLTHFLDPEAARVPSLALHQARLETARLGDLTRSMFARTTELFQTDSAAAIAALRRDEERSDQLEAEILRYMAQLHRQELSDPEVAEFQELITAVDDFESIADVISGDIARLAARLHERRLAPSEMMQNILTNMFNAVGSALDDAVRALRDQDPDAAQAVRGHKSEVLKLFDEGSQHQRRRFLESEDDRIDLFRIEASLIDKARRIYSLTKRIAKRVSTPLT